jgi:hypothetical protein
MMVEHTDYGDFAQVMPEIKQGYVHGCPWFVEYFTSGGVAVVLRWCDMGEWHETGNEVFPVSVCLTPVRERRRLLRAMR